MSSVRPGTIDFSCRCPISGKKLKGAKCMSHSTPNGTIRIIEKCQFCGFEHKIRWVGSLDKPQLSVEVIYNPVE